MESDHKIKRGYINKLCEQTWSSAGNAIKAVLKPVITLHRPILKSPGSTIPFLINLICSIAGLGWSVIGLKGGSARRDKCICWVNKMCFYFNVFFCRYFLNQLRNLYCYNLLIPTFRTSI